MARGWYQRQRLAAKTRSAKMYPLAWQRGTRHDSLTPLYRRAALHYYGILPRRACIDFSGLMSRGARHAIITAILRAR